MGHTTDTGVEQHAMRLLLTALGCYAFWTVLLQLATFIGISWAALTQAAAWLVLPVLILSYWQAGHLARQYAQHLPERLIEPSGLNTGYVGLVGISFLGFCAFFPGYTERYVVFMLFVAAIMAFAGRKTVAGEGATAPPSSSDRLSAWLTYGCLIGLVSLAALIVVSVNRPDPDDTHFIQLAIQTLRYPERAPNTFDASLGLVLEQFRFAPYRVTAYETFIALMTQWTGLNILDVYYLLVPAVSAALSILAAFVFTRWFLPLRWSLLAIGLFLLLSLAWGETHIAYGNRMYVRLFQGKGLLVAITTPLTVIMALLWMRKPSANTFLGLLIMQVVAVGVSSAGLVITLFATTVGLLAGFLTQPSYHSLWAVCAGGATLAYPIGLGLWLKCLSPVSGKIERMGTYLPINASLGETWREALVFAIIITAVWVITGARRGLSQVNGSSRAETAAKNYLWLVVSCFLLIFNPFTINYLTGITARNMNWRLGWAAPVPLLLAVSLSYLLHWAQGKDAGARQKTAWLLPIGLMVAFASVNPWTLATSNQVHWDFLGHKVQPEYHQAVELAADIRQQTRGQQNVTVLVEPLVGAWLTVVAPDFQLIMPGHAYPGYLKTILDPHDFDQRKQLLNGMDAIARGDESLNKLLDAYGVNVLAFRAPAASGYDRYRVQIRAVDDSLKRLSTGGAN